MTSIRGVDSRDAFVGRLDALRTTCSAAGWGYGGGAPLQETSVVQATALAEALARRGIPWPYAYPTDPGGGAGNVQVRRTLERAVTRASKEAMSKLSDAEYNEWYLRGYASFTEGTELPPDATPEQRAAWRDGLNTAVEEDEADES